MDELKPCPFCGKQIFNRRIVAVNLLNSTKTNYKAEVECSWCGASIKGVSCRNVDAAIADAERLWNTRAE